MSGGTLCPSCGSHPIWATTVRKNQQILEKTWFCPRCAALIEASAPPSLTWAQVVGYVDPSDSALKRVM
jgi:hypothetical protein